MSAHRTDIRELGPRAVRSPLTSGGFVADSERILREIELPRPVAGGAPRFFELAGPRAELFFDPTRVHAAIVTAGGVCPGINDVIRGLVLELRHRYGVRAVTGFRYGFRGLVTAPPIELDLASVASIHMTGGTMLGTARGPADPRDVVDVLEREGVQMLFVVGGDGSMRAAHAVAEEAARRNAAIAVVGIPKTIDNDIPFVDKTFGFDTAVSTARIALEAAHAEAISGERGVALVKLMGRHAGFLAAHATLASHDVNACLVPEVPFELEGPHGLLRWLDRRLEARGHAVIVVAEGCTLPGANARERDASGNERLAADDRDVGRLLKRAIERSFDRATTLKYIDPSYIVRALRATAEDATFCDALARNAVHAAMAGKTDILVGRWHRRFTHVALSDALRADKRLDPNGPVWRQVLEATGQPSFVAGARSAERIVA
ncbi:MAG: ATP-dependent 6-phosphofructokinase [Labilithrix sp.]|nr:ATP-dependent 6-phosphofructokinase [Labilithrix sp.]MCW5812535.1 ATP-dependent 6-phosphofructokinase [Labilithrix sp.]